MTTGIIVAIVTIVVIVVGCSIWAINKGYSHKNEIDEIDEP